MPTKTPRERAKTKPLAGYVTLFYYLQTTRPQTEIEALLNQELEGKRREKLIRLLVGRIFYAREAEYLNSIGIK